MSTFWNGFYAPLANATWIETLVDKYPMEPPCYSFVLGIDAALVAGRERPFVLVDLGLRLV